MYIKGKKTKTYFLPTREPCKKFLSGQNLIFRRDLIRAIGGQLSVRPSETGFSDGLLSFGKPHNRLPDHLYFFKTAAIAARIMGVSVTDTRPYLPASKKSAVPIPKRGGLHVDTGGHRYGQKQCGYFSHRSLLK